MFQTLEERRQQQTDKTERAIRWIGGAILGMILLASVYLATMIIH
jgi:hypothetical protein